MMGKLKKIALRTYRKIIYLSCVVTFQCIALASILDKNFQHLFEENRYSEYLLRSLPGPMKYDNQLLVDYVANEVLIPPSSLPYHFTRNIVSKFRLPSEEFYARNLEIIFNTTENGFFVEAGALDGETMSNTLWLEKHQGWTGLLVEPDPSQFIAMKSKHRKSWLANACLSIEEFPKLEMLSSVDIGSAKDRSMGSIMREDSEYQGLTRNYAYSSYYTSQCYPLGSLLLAMNVNRIDLLSLDVEFVEDAILHNFDFKKFDVQVMFIEHHKYKTFRNLHDFLVSKGYEFITSEETDYIYCKMGTKISERLKELYPKRILVEIFVYSDNSTTA